MNHISSVQPDAYPYLPPHVPHFSAFELLELPNGGPIHDHSCQTPTELVNSNVSEVNPSQCSSQASPFLAATAEEFSGQVYDDSQSPWNDWELVNLPATFHPPLATRPFSEYEQDYPLGYLMHQMDYHVVHLTADPVLQPVPEAYTLIWIDKLNEQSSAGRQDRQLDEGVSLCFLPLTISPCLTGATFESL